MQQDLNPQAVIKSAAPRNGDLLANGCVYHFTMHSKLFSRSSVE